MYTQRGLSMMQISAELGCSHNRVVYWMHQHEIPRRTISDALTILKYPAGDPFVVPVIDTVYKAQLYGTGLGLYWGEGTKANKHSVRLGNSDPILIKTFMRFLIKLYEVDIEHLRFGLQIFTDIDANEALSYWISKLGVKATQFYKVHITLSDSIGTYRKKSQYGVVTLYYNNKRLRDILVQALPGYVN